MDLSRIKSKKIIFVLPVILLIITALTITFLILDSSNKAVAETNHKESISTPILTTDKANFGIKVNNFPEGKTPVVKVTDRTGNIVPYQIGNTIELQAPISYIPGEYSLTLNEYDGNAYTFTIETPYGYQLNITEPEDPDYTTNGGFFTFNYSPYVGTYTINEHIGNETHTNTNLSNILVSYYNYNFDLVQTAYTDSSGEFTMTGISKENSFGTLFAKLDGYCDIYKPIKEENYIGNKTRNYAIDLRALNDANLKLNSNCPELQYFDITSTIKITGIYEGTNRLTLPCCTICLNGDIQGDYVVNTDGSLYGQYSDDFSESTLSIKPKISNNYNCESWSIDTDGAGTKNYLPGETFTINEENTNAAEHLFGTVNFSKTQEVPINPISNETKTTNEIKSTSAQTGDSCALPIAVIATIASSMIVSVSICRKRFNK